ncbi:MAG: ABC transporter substrate-binding protein, partial [Candidatus Dormibacteraceae bacterium]
MLRPGLKVVGLLTGLLLLLPACGGSSFPSTKLAAEQTLKFPIFDELHTLDPARIDAEPDVEIAQNLFNGLFRFDNRGALQPDIATSIPRPSADGLTYLFRLRSDVRFWNGDRVTAKDVLYSWNRAANLQGSHAATFAAVQGFDEVAKNGKIDQNQLQQLLVKGDPSVSMSGLTAPDGPLGYTVQVKLSHPADWFLSAIAFQSNVGTVLDSTAVGSDPLNWWQKPQTLVGTGAY